VHTFTPYFLCLLFDFHHARALTFDSVDMIVRREICDSLAFGFELMLATSAERVTCSYLSRAYPSYFCVADLDPVVRQTIDNTGSIPLHTSLLDRRSNA
jgi:hypothetical protein